MDYGGSITAFLNTVNDINKNRLLLPLFPPNWFNILLLHSSHKTNAIPQNRREHLQLAVIPRPINHQIRLSYMGYILETREEGYPSSQTVPLSPSFLD